METRDSPHLLQSILKTNITVYLMRDPDSRDGYRLEIRDNFYKRPCTAEEIKAYQEFASLSLDERRRRVIAKFIEGFPDSEFTRAVTAGRYPVPKKRGRRSSAAGRSSAKGEAYEKGI